MSTDTVARPPGDALQEAFAHCERLAKRHYENFAVVTWFLPKQLKPSMYAVYAFCRQTDDLGDEAPGERLALLDTWERELKECFGGAPQHPVMLALQETIRRHEIPVTPFLKLIEANRMDQLVLRYPTYADLLTYCEHSANPVGQMVLHVFGYSDRERMALSDATCTALQLANFLQDIRRDYDLGRVYLPQEDMARFSYTEDMLARNEYNEEFRQLMAFEAARALRLLKDGSALAGTVSRELRLDLQLFTAGGMAILDAIKRRHFDVLSSRPRVGKGTKARLAATALTSLAAQRLGLARTNG